MTSVQSSLANTGRGSAFYVNVSGSSAPRLDSNGNSISGNVPAGGIVHDMGVKVYLPDIRSGVMTSQILRKVQLSNGVNGTGSADLWDTFYIDVTGPSSAWASLGL